MRVSSGIIIKKWLKKSLLKEILLILLAGQ